MSISKITSTGVQWRPTLQELGWRLSRSAFTKLNSWSSSSSSSRRASSGSNSSSSLGTISKRFTGSYPSTIMVAPLLWRFLGIRILQERLISHRKLSRQLNKITGHSPVSRWRPFQPLVVFSQPKIERLPLVEIVSCELHQIIQPSTLMVAAHRLVQRPPYQFHRIALGAP